MAKTNLNKKTELNEKERKEALDKIMKHRFFVTQTGYPPQNGFLEYGPVLTAMKNEMINMWRRIVVDEEMMEIDTSVMVPYDVLKASGHIDKFCDVVLTDGITTVRADHFIEEKAGEHFMVPQSCTREAVERVKQLKHEMMNQKTIENKLKSIKLNKFKQFDKKKVELITSKFDTVRKHLSDCNKDEIDFIVQSHNLTTETGEFMPAKDFNLIFKLNDGQFLRPELAQGIFANFSKEYVFNNGQMPFACYTIGKSYRNEISARGGMFRTKEFYQAEIEYYTEDGSHADFDYVINNKLTLLPNAVETPFEMNLKDAYSKKIISSQAICVFISRCHIFITEIGIDLSRVRYRQHHVCEMATTPMTVGTWKFRLLVAGLNVLELQTDPITISQFTPSQSTRTSRRQSVQSPLLS
ncbi:SYG [Enterospora canceri]|uniref:SYG n=1 Tax=Enterospora canceri TaxID=1081671 RepID=A0A1Y1S5G1_9MICR|nr:SYG [Enterospora canceri]